MTQATICLCQYAIPATARTRGETTDLEDETGHEDVRGGIRVDPAL